MSNKTELMLIIQREFTRRITALQGLSYWDRLKKLKLMSLKRRRERYVLLIMWKILHGVLPNELGISFRPQGRLGIQAVIPGMARGCTQRNRSFYDSSFAVLGPSTWNLLPSCLNTVESECAFKKQLTEYLLHYTLADVTRS